MSRVVRVGPLMPYLEEALVRDHAAPLLADGGTSEAEVAVTSYGTGLTAETMDRLPSLRAIASFGVGYDTTDVAEAARRGISVANTPHVLDDAVAEVAVGLVIDLMRGLSESDRFVRRGAWAAGEGFRLTRQVSGARAGIVGLGRIGTAIARRLAALDMQIGYHSRTDKGVEWPFHPHLLSLAEASDVLVVATAGGPETAGLISAEVLEALGPDGFLVNVARGSVVDEDALVAALEAGAIAGAGLDVYADEPHVPPALLGRDDVVLLPHLASGTNQTRQAMADLVLANVACWLEAGELVTPVD